jgi:hypothetical protein
MGQRARLPNPRRSTQPYSFLNRAGASPTLHTQGEKVWSASMTDEESRQTINQWQNRLHDAFDYNGVLGGKYLWEIMRLEEAVGQFFVQKYHGYRLLTDAFLDFFAESTQTQLPIIPSLAGHKMSFATFSPF